ncbi:hypothetical protein [uncultured Amnibacterium sp.]|uniref:hypothetical protein n=1 Tax=uncultured Amnibacterium sp. TaxID=1631851 RepID=UPI0035C98759
MTDLQTRLAALDPARDLPPLPEAQRAALLQRAAAGPRRAPRPPRRALWIGVPAGLVAAAAAAFLLSPADVRPTIAVGPSTTRITLTMSSDATAMCMPVADFAAQALAGSTVALSGTVEAVGGDRVAVRVDRQYRGEPVDEVLVDAPAEVEDPTILPAGAHVLIAAQDGRVLGCGLSGEASPDLQGFYDAAF